MQHCSQFSIVAHIPQSVSTMGRRTTRARRHEKHSIGTDSTTCTSRSSVSLPTALHVGREFEAAGGARAWALTGSTGRSKRLQVPYHLLQLCYVLYRCNLSFPQLHQKTKVRVVLSSLSTPWPTLNVMPRWQNVVHTFVDSKVSATTSCLPEYPSLNNCSD
jgi:hypothetical protein